MRSIIVQERMNWDIFCDKFRGETGFERHTRMNLNSFNRLLGLIKDDTKVGNEIQGTKRGRCISPDIKLVLANAGHILGSALCHFHIGNGDHSFVYSGDMKFGSVVTLYTEKYLRWYHNADIAKVNLSRMDIAKSVIKKIVSNTELTSKAKFGLMEWGWPYPTSNGGMRIRVPISSSGAKTIFTNVDGVMSSEALL